MKKQEQNKTFFLHINLLIKYSVQQQIHFNGNVFTNKCCRCNKGSLYVVGTSSQYMFLCRNKKNIYLLSLLTWSYDVSTMWSYYKGNSLRDNLKTNNNETKVLNLKPLTKY